MTRILVTGGFGYVGSALLPLLSSTDISVTVASRTVRPDARVKTLVLDWSDQGSIRRACQDQDIILHLAAMPEPGTETVPEAALMANGLATLRLLEAATEAGATRFLYASTSKVFGNNPSGVLDENALPRPTSHYAITHRLSEDYVLAAGAKGRIEGVVFRLANMIGAPPDPQSDACRVLSNDLCRQAIADGAIMLKSSGEAWRNFVTKADVATALLQMIRMPASRIGDGLFHVGGSRSITIWDFARRVAELGSALTGNTITADHLPPAPNERHALLDWKTEKLRAAGWSPTDDIDAEIDNALKFFQRLQMDEK